MYAIKNCICFCRIATIWDMELASKERLNNKYNRECNLKCKA